MKKIVNRSFLCFCLILVLIVIMTGCENDTDGNDKQLGVIVFYKEPTLERTKPASSITYELSKEQKKELKSIIKSIKKWTDDSAVDRLAFYFDGEFTFFGEETTYYFSYEYELIYYDHYFAGVAPEQMQYIKNLNANG